MVHHNSRHIPHERKNSPVWNVELAKHAGERLRRWMHRHSFRANTHARCSLHSLAMRDTADRPLRYYGRFCSPWKSYRFSSRPTLLYKSLNFKADLKHMFVPSQQCVVLYPTESALLFWRALLFFCLASTLHCRDRFLTYPCFYHRRPLPYSLLLLTAARRLSFAHRHLLRL